MQKKREKVEFTREFLQLFIPKQLMPDMFRSKFRIDFSILLAFHFSHSCSLLSCHHPPPSAAWSRTWVTGGSWRQPVTAAAATTALSLLKTERSKLCKKEKIPIIAKWCLSRHDILMQTCHVVSSQYCFSLSRHHSPGGPGGNADWHQRATCAPLVNQSSLEMHL
jgi:hypothetical protein